MDISLIKITRMEADVYLAVSKSFIPAMKAELEPYLLVEGGMVTRPRDAWLVCSEEAYTESTDQFQPIMGRAVEGPDTHFLISFRDKVIVVVERNAKWAIKHLSRLIRNLLRWQLYCGDYFYLHGGAIELDGHGIAFLGRKKSGKTSSILSALIHLEASYITNDDLTLRIDKHGELNVRALGWPRAVGIRRDTIEALEPLKGRISGNELDHPANDYIDEKDKRYLTPNELVHACHSRIAADTKLAAVIFPVFNDRAAASIRRLDPLEAYRYLQENCERYPDQFSDYFIGQFDIMPSHELEQKLMELSRLLPCYELNQSMESLRDGSVLAKQILRECVTG